MRASARLANARKEKRYMEQFNPRSWAMAFAALFTVAHTSSAADHGPVFGLATPTNPQGGWSFDLGVNGRGGLGLKP